MLSSYIFFENSGPETEEKTQLKHSLTGRLQINNIRYQCVQREGVAVTATTIELTSYQTQEDSYEKKPKQNPHKKLWEGPRFRNSATLRIVCLVKSDYPNLFLGW